MRFFVPAAMVSLMNIATAGYAATFVDLRSAATFGVLGGTAVKNTGPTVVAGDVGVSPGATITGFPPGVATGVLHAGDAVAAQARSDLADGYDFAAGQTGATDLSGQDLGGLTLTPGLYRFASSAFLTGMVTLDARGDADAVFVFQVGSTLITASNAAVLLTNGGTGASLFWQVGSSATLGTGTTFNGSILALTSITLGNGATIGSGRALARDGVVTLDTNLITVPVAAVPEPATWGMMVLGFALAGGAIRRGRRSPAAGMVGGDGLEPPTLSV